MVLAIIISILCGFLVFCGVTLYLIQSSLYSIIRHFGAIIAAVIGLLAICLFVASSSIAVLGFGSFILLVLLGSLCFAVINVLAYFLTKAMLVPRKKEGRKKAVVTSSSLALISTFDGIVSLCSGFALGFSFIQGASTAMLLFVSLALFMILDRVMRIEQLEREVVPETAVRANLLTSIICMIVGLIFSAIMSQGMRDNKEAYLVLPIACLLFYGLKAAWSLIAKLRAR
jgi:hypothetical protein